MTALNFSVRYLRDGYGEAQSAVNAGDYQTAVIIGQLALYVRNTAVLARDHLALLGLEIVSADLDGADTVEASAFYHSALDALAQERYDDALALIERSQQSLKTAQTERNRLKLIERVQQNFFLRNKWIIAALLLAALAVSYPLYFRTRRFVMQRRLQRFRIDLDETLRLIKRLQYRCFIDKKMTAQSYKTKALMYEEHVAELKHVIPVLEAQLEGKKTSTKKGVIEVFK